MKILRPLLFPFAILYGIIVWIRNLLFDINILKNNRIPVPSIGVGNLSSGGTGKTVVIDYLIDLLKDQYSVGVLSRGYKRQTSGVVLADKLSSVQEIGDEPFQLLKKHPEIQVVVSEKRVLGVRKFLTLSNPPKVILLDDIMQHRFVVPDLLIMTTTYQNPYFSDFLLPLGNLRESRAGSKRANILLITKCPATLNPKQQNSFLKRIRLPSIQHIFFTKIEYSDSVTNGIQKIVLNQIKKPFLLITGIANPKPLIQFLKEAKFDFIHLKFPDHYSFGPDDVVKINEKKGKGMVMTTEKDFTRLEPILGIENLYYLPIEMSFINSEEQKHFNQLIRKQID